MTNWLKRSREWGTTELQREPSPPPTELTELEYSNGSFLNSETSTYDQQDPKRHKIQQFKLTDEQETIINHARQMKSTTGQITKIIAGAGSGKTTTLERLAQMLVLEKCERVLYVVFNKSAESDAKNRFRSIEEDLISSGTGESIGEYGGRGVIKCCTMHSAALTNLTLPCEYLDKLEVSVDQEVKDQLREDYSGQIERWLEQNQPLSHKKGPRRLKKDIELAEHWIYKTIEAYCRGIAAEFTERDVYYPCRKNMKAYLGFEDFKFFRRIAADVWKRMWSEGVGFPISHDHYQKYAQLGNMRIPQYTTVLVDESQDVNQCQLELFVTNQANGRYDGVCKNVFVVGDAAQTINSFRGAKAKYLTDLKAHHKFALTKSFRFGPVIEKVANRILWMKEKSPQRKHFDPYRIVGASSFQGCIVSQNELMSQFPYTVIARGNAELVKEGLRLLEFYREQQRSNETSVKISMNTNTKELKHAMNRTLAIYNFKRGIRPPPHQKFLDDYEDYDEFLDDVQKKELNNYNISIALVNIYGEELPDAIKRFSEEIVERKYSPDEADIIMTTVHKAKGLEWDRVCVLNDLLTLKLRPSKNSDRFEFDVNDWNDELNCWYVAVTRAKKWMCLPDNWHALDDFIKNVLKLTSVPYDRENPSFSETSANYDQQILEFYGDKYGPNEIAALGRLFRTFDW